MDFKLSPRHQAMQKMFREFVDKEIAPRAAYYDETGEFPRENISKMASLGFMGIPVPESLGGAGADFLSYILFLEQLSRGCAATGVIVAVHTSVGTFPIINFGTDEQKQKYVPGMAAGRLLGAFALTESGAGSDAASIKTTARRQGDFYLLNGSKIFITNGGEADVYIVFATLNPSAGGKGITAFIVEKDTPGFKIGAKEKKMGLNASATTELIFDDARVPAANRLGREGEGLKIALSLLDGGRIGIGAQALGIAQAAYEAARDYAKTREQFGTPIAGFQAVSFKLADMATQIEAARLLVYQAAWRKDNGLENSKQASMAKLLASDTAVKTAIEAVQILGGYGYTRDFPVERYLRDAKVTQIYEGTNQIQRLVIGKQVLKG